jgi:hypothetical protein
MNSEGVNTEPHHANDACHRDGEIEMRPHRFDPSLEDEAANAREQDHVRERDHERQSGDAGEFGDLDQDQLTMQRGAERVPAPAGEDDTAKPFLADPGRGEEKCEPEIAERAEPGRTPIG